MLLYKNSLEIREIITRKCGSILTNISPEASTYILRIFFKYTRILQYRKHIPPLVSWFYVSKFGSKCVYVI